MLEQAIEEYLLWMIEAGYSRKTCRKTGRILGYFGEFVQTHRIPWKESFTHAALNAFEKEHQDSYAGTAVRGLWRYLLRQGEIDESLIKKKRLPEIYEEYLHYYGRRVLAERVTSARKVLSGLHEYLQENTITLSTLKIFDLDTFLALHTASFTPKVRQNRRYYLRGFLRYLFYERKVLKKDLASLLTGAPIFSQAKPPKFLRPHEVQKLFHMSKPKTPWEIRAYAMLYLAYTLGLRSKEISLIGLDNISFGNKEVTIGDRKNTQPLILPLPEDTIKAIAAYIVGVRPKSAYRTLFLSLQPPIAPLCSAQVSRNITKLMRKANVPGSAYWLRHTFAQNLLERGASIYEIKEMLGHEDIQSSEKYLRVHINLMREVILNETL